ncbi:hypothetical protein DYB32_006658 [Aphanomyces invadans]|uniref:AAA+ ATPase domain-containing protein n=1 Tax=Aphanomyces invadans TaxID=157072 RepID=A0A418AQX6_9STRA|nr:hypothetical protein DYB32_006658 [Aphanomyces invadans]
MNALRTSNVIFDTLICLLIPIVFKRILDSFNQFATKFATLRDLFRRQGDEIVRRIERKTHFNARGIIHDYEEHNHILQNAISIYLSDHLDMDKKSGRYEVLDNLNPPEDNDAHAAEREDDLYDDDPYGENESFELQRLKIGALPPLNQWIKIEPELEFYHEVTNDEGGGGNSNGDQGKSLEKSTITFILRSSAADATQRIDSFVNRAFQSYQDAVVAKHKKDKTRYMYMAATQELGPGKSSAAAVVKYKRYGLSDDKTFDSLFFDEKPKLLSLLDNFMTKSGKFGVKGIPYKMGLLLHGPPGTGKTSLIKAVAQYTKRHIVNVSLSKIKTNQELMDMMFDLTFRLYGEDWPATLRFDQIVFVMEDVDCASNVVLARMSGGKMSSRPRRRRNRRDADQDNEKPNGDIGDVENDLAIGPKNLASDRMSGWVPKDKLNLSGLLNVLDGVVDSPGRILIMTTNHPEKLDPALIRPGRVNKKVELGPINGRQTQAMIEHYFATALSQAQRNAVARVIANASNSFSPAQIEQLCAEHYDIDDMLAELAVAVAC